jgi:hypothetical protein
MANNPRGIPLTDANVEGAKPAAAPLDPRFQYTRHADGELHPTTQGVPFELAAAQRDETLARHNRKNELYNRAMVGDQAAADALWNEFQMKVRR